MKGGIRQSMAWLHTWSGLLVGWVLFMVFAAGTASYSRDEITLWMKPELHAAAHAAVPQAVALAHAVDTLQDKAPGSPRRIITMPTGRHRRHRPADRPRHRQRRAVDDVRRRDGPRRAAAGGGWRRRRDARRDGRPEHQRRGRPAAGDGVFLGQPAARHRQRREIRWFFTAWDGAAIAALARPGRPMWRLQLAAGGLAFALLPVLNGATGGAHLGTSIAHGLWPVAGFDLVALLLGAFLLYGSHYLGKAASGTTASAASASVAAPAPASAPIPAPTPSLAGSKP